MVSQDRVHCTVFPFIVVGAGNDAGGVVMVDSIKVYVKTKESFGWPEDSEDFPDPSTTVTKPTVTTTTPGFMMSEQEAGTLAPLPLSSVDR